MSHLTMTEEQLAAYQARQSTARVVKGRDTAYDAKPVGRPKTKYGNAPTKVGQTVFASKREADRFAELNLLEKAGEIRALELQPKFNCMVNGQKVCSYRADFAYQKNGKRIIEDVKGYKTPLYRLKKKLVLACLGIEVVEIT